MIGLHRSQKGITGLETAIILIAFVVVAAVFAYTVLSAGLFSTQKSQEAVYSGIAETQSTIAPRGNVVAYKGDVNISSSVGKVEICVSIATAGGDPVDLTPNYALAGGALVDSGLDNPTQITFTNPSVTVADCAFTLSWVGNHTDDYLLENNEKAVITAWLHDYDGTNWSNGSSPPFLAGQYVLTDSTFSLEIKPPSGAVLNVERTTPAYLDTVIDLH